MMMGANCIGNYTRLFVLNLNPKTIYTNDKNQERQTPKIKHTPKNKISNGENDQ
jgi:hypothetical protein